MKTEFVLMLIIVLALFVLPAVAFQSLPKFVTIEFKSRMIDLLGTCCSIITPQEPASGGGGQGVT
jgi:hypothetical protein